MNSQGKWTPQFCQPISFGDTGVDLKHKFPNLEELHKLKKPPKLVKIVYKTLVQRGEEAYLAGFKLVFNDGHETPMYQAPKADRELSEEHEIEIEPEEEITSIGF